MTTKAHAGGDAPISLHGHIAQHRKELVNTQTLVSDKRARIKALQQEIAKCTGRHQIRRKYDLQEEIAALDADIVRLQSDHAVSAYDERVKPFLQEHARCKDIYRMEDRLGKTVDTLATQKRRRDHTDHTNTAATTTTTTTGAASSKLMSFVRKKARTDQLLASDEGGNATKTRVVDDYLMAVQGQAPPLVVNNEDLCEKCREPLILESEQSILVCKACGRSKRYMDATSNAMAYGEEVEFCAYSYQRTNYFNEYLTMFQAKETSQVAQKDIDAVMSALWEERIYNKDLITLEKIREIVRKKRMRHVYKQITQIWCRITGNLPPRLTVKQEEKCRAMFRAIQEPFERHCPQDRKNFFSYSYCLFKFMQLLGYPQFLKHFTLLKDRPKLKLMDAIWEKICKDLDWEFIESPKE